MAFRMFQNSVHSNQTPIYNPTNIPLFPNHRDLCQYYLQFIQQTHTVITSIAFEQHISSHYDHTIFSPSQHSTLREFPLPTTSSHQSPINQYDCKVNGVSFDQFISSFRTTNLENFDKLIKSHSKTSQYTPQFLSLSDIDLFTNVTLEVTIQRPPMEHIPGDLIYLIDPTVISSDAQEQDPFITTPLHPESLPHSLNDRWQSLLYPTPSHYHGFINDTIFNKTILNYNGNVPLPQSELYIIQSNLFKTLSQFPNHLSLLQPRQHILLHNVTAPVYKTKRSKNRSSIQNKGSLQTHIASLTPIPSPLQILFPLAFSPTLHHSLQLTLLPTLTSLPPVENSLQQWLENLHFFSLLSSQPSSQTPLALTVTQYLKIDRGRHPIHQMIASVDIPLLFVILWFGNKLILSDNSSTKFNNSIPSTKTSKIASNILLQALSCQFPPLHFFLQRFFKGSSRILQLYRTKYNCTVNNRCLLALYKASIEIHEKLSQRELHHLRLFRDLSIKSANTTDINEIDYLSDLLLNSPSSSMLYNNKFDQLIFQLALSSSPSLLRDALNLGLHSFFTYNSDQLDIMCTTSNNTNKNNTRNSQTFHSYATNILQKLFYAIEQYPVLFQHSNYKSIHAFLLKIKIVPEHPSVSSFSSFSSLHDIPVPPPQFPNLSYEFCPPLLNQYFVQHKFNPSQQQAIIKALLSHYSSVCAGPGCGKTFLISHITTLYFLSNTTTSQCYDFHSNQQVPTPPNETSEIFQPRRLLLTGHSHSSVDQMMLSLVKTIKTQFNNYDPASLIPAPTIPFLFDCPPNINSIPLTIVRLGLQDQFVNLKDLAAQQTTNKEQSDQHNMIQNLREKLSLTNHIRNNIDINPHAISCTIFTLIQQYTLLLQGWGTTAQTFSIQPYQLQAVIKKRLESQNVNTPPVKLLPDITSTRTFDIINNIAGLNTFFQTSRVFEPIWTACNPIQCTTTDIIADLLSIELEQYDGSGNDHREPLVGLYLTNFFTTLYHILMAINQYTFPIPSNISDSESKCTESLLTTFKEKVHFICLSVKTHLDSNIHQNNPLLFDVTALTSVSKNSITTLNILGSFLNKYYTHAATIIVLQHADIVCGTIASIGRLFYPIQYSSIPEKAQEPTSTTQSVFKSQLQNVVNKSKYVAREDTQTLSGKKFSKQPLKISSNSQLNSPRNSPNDTQFDRNYVEYVDTSLFDTDFDTEYDNNALDLLFQSDNDTINYDDESWDSYSVASNLLTGVDTMTDDAEVLELLNAVDGLFTKMTESRLDSLQTSSPRSYLSSASILFPIITFSMVILDEASQTPSYMISLPSSILAPALSCSSMTIQQTTVPYSLLNSLSSNSSNLSIIPPRIVFVGDTNQLPPTVVDPLGHLAQFHISVLDCFSSSQSSSQSFINDNDDTISPNFTMLDVQYRMHPSIAKIISILFYQNKLTSPQDHQICSILASFYSNTNTTPLLHLSQYSLSPIPPSFLLLKRYKTYFHTNISNHNCSSLNPFLSSKEAISTTFSQLPSQFTSSVLPMQLFHHTSPHSKNSQLQSHFNTKEAQLIAQGVCVAIGSSVFTTTMLLSHLLLLSVQATVQSTANQALEQLLLIIQTIQSTLYSSYFDLQTVPLSSSSTTYTSNHNAPFKSRKQRQQEQCAQQSQPLIDPFQSQIQFQSVEQISSSISHLLTTTMNFTTSRIDSSKDIQHLAYYITSYFLTPPCKISIISMYNAQIPIIQSELLKIESVLQTDQSLHHLIAFSNVIILALNYFTIVFPLIFNDPTSHIISQADQIIQRLIVLSQTILTTCNCKPNLCSAPFISASFHEASEIFLDCNLLNTNTLINPLPIINPATFTALSSISNQSNSKTKSSKPTFTPSILTVDSSQGTENDLVFVSTVRNPGPITNQSSSSLGFMTDRNRINVALSRAKRGVVIFGNAFLLGGYVESIKIHTNKYRKSKIDRNSIHYLYALHMIKKKNRFSMKKIASLTLRDQKRSKIPSMTWSRLVTLLLQNQNVIDAQKYFTLVFQPNITSCVYFSPALPL